MRAERILSGWLEPLTDFMHAKRQRALLDVVGALMKGRRLWVTTLGRALPGPAKFKHRIKRVDRLLGNHRSRAVRALRAQRADLPVVLLADGAPELWNLFEEYLNERTIGVAPRPLVDAWHALEYVSAASRLLEKHEWAWPGSFRRMKRWLLEEEHGVERVLRALERGGLERMQDETGRRCDSIPERAQRLDALRRSA